MNENEDSTHEKFYEIAVLSMVHLSSGEDIIGYVADINHATGENTPEQMTVKFPLYLKLTVNDQGGAFFAMNPIAPLHNGEPIIIEKSHILFKVDISPSVSRIYYDKLKDIIKTNLQTEERLNKKLSIESSLEENEEFVTEPKEESNTFH